MSDQLKASTATSPGGTTTTSTGATIKALNFKSKAASPGAASPTATLGGFQRRAQPPVCAAPSDLFEVRRFSY